MVIFSPSLFPGQSFLSHLNTEKSTEACFYLHHKTLASCIIYPDTRPEVKIMPPRKAAAENADGGATAFTDGEIKLVKAVFDSMNTRPDIDFENVANIMGLANAKSARDRFRVVSKKHGWTSTDGSGGAAAGGDGSSKAKGPLAPKNTTKVTKKPAPKKKGTARKKTKKEVESDDDEDITGKLESDSDGKTIPKDEPMESSSEDDD